MRIIAGKFRSRQLHSLKGLRLRPTSDRLRETLFNVLGDLVPGSCFVDLFAGTGAVGIEALSRGAREAVFVEKHPPAVALIRKNLESLEIQQGVRILQQDAWQAMQLLAKQAASRAAVDVLFLDPPYAEESKYTEILAGLGDSGILAPNAVVISEHLRALDLPDSFGKLEQVRVLGQGDAALSFYRYRPSSPPENSRSK
jgi:16S rRNA (guanine(966)-N(2))-methyltransferase RsmD